MQESAIDTTFEGIPGVTLGGYVAGLAAKDLGWSVAVTLTKPIPPGSTFTLEPSGLNVLLRFNDEVAATAAPSQFETTAPDAVSLEEAVGAAERYPGFNHHFFPRCFTCGPDRSSGEGLRVFPGAVEGRDLVAAEWKPPSLALGSNGTVASEFLWAALDCPAIWAQIVHGHGGTDDRAVSGRLALQVHGPVPGDDYSIVVGWPIERQERKIIVGAGIFSTSGHLLVEARQTLILTDAGVPLSLAAWARA